MGIRLWPSKITHLLYAVLGLFGGSLVSGFLITFAWFTWPDQITRTLSLLIWFACCGAIGGLFSLRHLKLNRGLSLEIHEDRYELYRFNQLSEMVRWSEVTGFEPGLFCSTVICGDRRTPFIYVHEGPTAYQQAQAWLTEFSQGSPFLRVARRHRVALFAIFVLSIIGMALIGRPDPDNFDSNKSGLLALVATIGQICMVLGVLGLGKQHRRPEDRVREPLVFTKSDLEPGVTYVRQIGRTVTKIRVEGEELVVDGARRFPLASGRATSFYNKNHATLRRQAHYRNGSDRYALVLNDLQRDGEPHSGTALGNRLKGSFLVGWVWAIFGAAVYFSAPYMAWLAFSFQYALVAALALSVLWLGLWGRLWLARRGYEMEIYTDRVETFRLGNPVATLRFEDIDRVESTPCGAWIVRLNGERVFLPEIVSASTAAHQLKVGLLGFRDLKAHRARAIVGATLSVGIMIGSASLVGRVPTPLPNPPYFAWLAIAAMGCLLPTISQLVAIPQPLRIDEGVLEPGVYENLYGRYEIHGDTLTAIEGDKTHKFPATPVRSGIEYGRHFVFKSGWRTLTLRVHTLKKVS